MECYSIRHEIFPGVKIRSQGVGINITYQLKPSRDNSNRDYSGTSCDECNALSKELSVRIIIKLCSQILPRKHSTSYDCAALIITLLSHVAGTRVLQNRYFVTIKHVTVTYITRSLSSHYKTCLWDMRTYKQLYQSSN